jgi:hypothetical protein
MVPFVTCSLSNVVFLPPVLVMLNFGDSFLMDRIPVNLPGSDCIILAFLLLLFPILTTDDILGPALISYIW